MASRPAADRAPQLRLRVWFGPDQVLGRGKIELLEGIASTGSIAAAARGMDMSYRRACQLLEALKLTFGQAMVETRKGGSQRGGARLTPAGETVCQLYRQLQAKAAISLADELAALEQLRLPPPA